jgi:hypothetical protein
MGEAVMEDIISYDKMIQRHQRLLVEAERKRAKKAVKRLKNKANNGFRSEK